MPQPLQRSPYGSARNPIGTPMIEMQSLDSTNNYARSLLYEGLAQHGTVLFAREQLAGKGQRGKVWVTEKDANIILSIVVNPEPLQLLHQFKLSACVAIAVHEFMMKYAGKHTKIKWPNDLYWQDRKAGGILIENIVGGDDSESMIDGRQGTIDNGHATTQWKWAIVGIGININQTCFSPELQNPVSLKQITGKQFDLPDLTKELCAILHIYFERLMMDGFDTIYDQYIRHLYKKNQRVKLKKDSRVFEVMIKGVSETGQLITHHAIEEKFDFGEVEWVI